MAQEVSSGLYDDNFSSWLQKRFSYLPPVPGQHRRAPKRYARVDVTKFLLADFDPKTLARLNALGLAT